MLARRWTAKGGPRERVGPGHPSQYYSGPKALNFRVLTAPGVAALV
jgi:hypothetical protein